MHIFTTTLICGFALMLSSAASFAETVYVSIGQQNGDQQSSGEQTLAKPEQGMTKTQVKQRFGQPRRWRDAVGQPPISSWTYDKFTVYFEYEHVIHSVLEYRPTNTAP